jgi:hypothetical protein
MSDPLYVTWQSTVEVFYGLVSDLVQFRDSTGAQSPYIYIRREAWSDVTEDLRFVYFMHKSES